MVRDTTFRDLHAVGLFVDVVLLWMICWALIFSTQ